MAIPIPNETWIPVGISSNIPPGSAHPVDLSGMELAVWRDEAGAPHVWEDRCPHRGMRLSFGFVRGDRLTCLYHGWEFDGAGSCKRIPAHPDMTPPETICTTGYAAAEAWGMVLTSSGNAHEPEATGAWHGIRSITVNAPVAEIENHLTKEGIRAGERFERNGPVLLAETPKGRIAIGLQPGSGDRTILHAATTDPDPAGRLASCRALVRLRNQLDGRA